MSSDNATAGGDNRQTTDDDQQHTSPEDSPEDTGQQLDDDADDQDADDQDADDQDDDSGGALSRLRRRMARYRTRAREAEQRAEQVARELWTERVAALGLLADPADLPFDPDALDDPDAIRDRAEELLQQRPHLRSRRITGHVGQRLQPGEPAVSLASILRAGA